MPATVPRILPTGPPRSGKTTLMCRLAQELTASGIAVGGFATLEIREEGRRVRFNVDEIGGRRALLAHVALSEDPRVGRCRVDAFEGLALSAIERVMQQGGVAITDEQGADFSLAFTGSFNRILGPPLAGTKSPPRMPARGGLGWRPRTKKCSALITQCSWRGRPGAVRRQRNLPRWRGSRTARMRTAVVLPALVVFSPALS